MKQIVWACDFCGKTQHELTLLVVGPEVAICDACINVASDVVASADQRAKSAETSIDTEPVAGAGSEQVCSTVVHQAQVENGRWIDIATADLPGYRTCFADVRTLYKAPETSAPHTGVRAAEIAQLLDELERIGANAESEISKICRQAGGVINALLTGLSADQLG